MEEQRSAHEISPKRAHKIWNQWPLRVMVLLSLALQIMLIIFGDRRRRRSNWARLLVWLMYLSADSVATIALGILSKNAHEDITSSSGTADPQSVIVSVWASFLLLHLGGPDTITAYSLEDNDLWLRHLLGLAVQVGGAIYVILMSQIVHTDHHHELMFLVMPIFVAGFIKYGERTWALRSACRMRLANALYNAPNIQDFKPSDRIRDLEKQCKIIRGSDPQSARIRDLESQIARLRNLVQRSYRIRYLQQQIARILCFEQQNANTRSGCAKREDAILGSNHLHEAFTLFEFLRDAYGDVLLDKKDQDESLRFLKEKSTEEAFQLVDIELGFLYDMIYTKAPIIWYNKFGFFLRIIAFLSSISALLMFCFIIDKKPYSNIDISITYLFAFGAVFLEIYSLILLIISDWGLIYLSESEKKWAKRVVYRAISSSWLASTNDHKIRWSGSIGQFNLFEFVSKHSTMLDLVLNRIGIYDVLTKNQYTTWEKVSAELKELVFQNLRNDREKVYSWRGDEVLRKYDRFNEFNWSIVKVEFDYSIIVWHIATTICYEYELGRCKGGSNSSLDSNCKMSKLLSDYMIFLLFVNPSMLPMGNGLRTFLEAWLYVTFFENGTYVTINRNGRKFSKKVFPDIISNNRASLCPSLNAGFNLARGLQSLETDHVEEGQQRRTDEKKWKMISEVWVDMLCYAACNCEWKDHATQLRRGGDFLTHVAVLMFHLGYNIGKSQKSNIISK